MRAPVFPRLFIAALLSVSIPFAEARQGRQSRENTDTTEGRGGSRQGQRPLSPTALPPQAISLYPKYCEAWFGLGQLYMYQRRDKEARESFTKAIESDNLYVYSYIQLAWLASEERQWREVADLTEHVLALNPVAYTEAYYLNAVAAYNSNKLDLAEQRARKEMQLDTAHRFPKVYLILANIFAIRQDAAVANEEMRNYLKYAPGAPDADNVRSAMHKNERLANGAAQSP